MELPQLPPINIDEYKWKQSESDPGLWQRRACAAEATVGVEAGNKRGENDMFFSAIAQLHDGHYALKDIGDAAQRSWKQLRFQHPEIACFNAHDGQVKCLLQYRNPEDDSEVQAWADKTIVVEASNRTPMEIRDASVEARKIGAPHSADAVVIHILAPVPTPDVQLGDAELRFVLHSNHLYIDGIGLREMIGAFFSSLAVELDKNVPDQSIGQHWDRSAQNLPPAFATAMRADQATSGAVFDDALKQKLGVAMQMMGSWCLKPQVHDKGNPDTVFHTFSREQSEKIVATVKSKLGKDYTITHLANAAMLLALVKSRPPPLDGDPIPFIPAAIIHGRRFMSAPYSTGEKPYYPVCQVNGNILYDDIREYAQAEGQENEEKTRALLAKGSKVAKEAFEGCINRPCAMATTIPIMEMFATMVHSTPPEHLPKIAVPMLASDGINDRYIAHEYFSASNQKVFSITDVHFWINQCSTIPFLRLSSWKERVRLSCDFNSTFYTQEYMQAFLDLVAEYMSFFAA